MQSATVTSNINPGVFVRWPSRSSRMVHPLTHSCQPTREPCTWCAMANPLNPASAARNARQRVMTLPTDSTVQSPRSKGSLPPPPLAVMPATTPNRSRQPGISKRGTEPERGVSASLEIETSVIQALDFSAEPTQSLVDPLVPPLDLPHVVNSAYAVRCERGQQHGHACSNVGRLDRTALEPGRTGDDRSVGIAQHDLRAHADKLVHEKQPGLEHFLEDEQHPGALGGGHDGRGHEIRRERRPGAILQLRHMPAEVRADSPLLLRVHDEPWSINPRTDTQAIEAEQRAAKVFRAHPVDGDLAVCDGRQSHEAADFDMIGTD